MDEAVLKGRIYCYPFQGSSHQLMRLLLLEQIYRAISGRHDHESMDKYGSVEFLYYKAMVIIHKLSQKKTKYNY